MIDFLNTPAGAYLAMGMIMVLIGATQQLFHTGIKRVESKVSQLLPAPDALKVNDFLDAVDRLAETAVQDANSRMVIGLKASGSFTPEVAKSVYQSVVTDVMANMGPLVEQGKQLVGPIEKIISQSIEKHVLNNKNLVNSLVGQLKSNTPA